MVGVTQQAHQKFFWSRPSDQKCSPSGRWSCFQGHLGMPRIKGGKCFKCVSSWQLLFPPEASMGDRNAPFWRKVTRVSNGNQVKENKIRRKGSVART